MDLYDGLNDGQREVVAWDEGRLVVPATAGAGKTRCVVHRIARLVQDGVNPDKILAITFSKEGSNEMNKRLVNLGVNVGGRDNKGGARVGTFHSLCHDIIRDGSPLEKWNFDRDGQLEKYLKAEILGYKGMKWLDADLRKVRGFIGHCKGELIAPENADHWDPRFCQAYALYEEARNEMRIYTYDCMIMESCLYLQENAEARARWQNKYEHVIIDECQDNNYAQWVLSTILGQLAKSWMAVGDDDQAIFEWRGARPEMLINFEKDRDAHLVTVSQNYRSRPEIIYAAKRLIEHNSNRIAKLIEPVRKSNGNQVVNTFVIGSMDEEARFVYERMLDLRASKGMDWKDFTILYRTNAQSRAFEEVFLQEKVPYYIVSRMDFWKRSEIKQLIEYLKVSVDKDNAACQWVINRPFRYIGRVAIEKFKKIMHRDNLGFYEAVRKNYRNRILTGLNSNQVDSLDRFFEITDQIGEKIANQMWTLPGALRWLIDQINFYDWITKDDGTDSAQNSKVANIHELMKTLERFDTLKDLLEYQQQLRAARRGRNKDASDTVTLMTIHKSKGLEFPIVFLVGACERLLPHAKSSELSEERRLFYVATTRAEEAIYITCPVHAFMDSDMTSMPPSRFINEAGLTYTNTGD